MPIKTRNVLAFAAMLAAALGTIEAHASCRGGNGACAKSTWDGRRVNIYLSNTMSGITHYNFKTNPGAQIEIGANVHWYSFQANSGRKGTYSVQACKRGGFGSRSMCTQWATWKWSSRTDVNDPAL
jgi:hypothetical protein